MVGSLVVGFVVDVADHGIECLLDDRDIALVVEAGAQALGVRPAVRQLFACLHEAGEFVWLHAVGAAHRMLSRDGSDRILETRASALRFLFVHSVELSLFFCLRERFLRLLAYGFAYGFSLSRHRSQNLSGSFAR